MTKRTVIGFSLAILLGVSTSVWAADSPITTKNLANCGLSEPEIWLFLKHEDSITDTEKDWLSTLKTGAKFGIFPRRAESFFCGKIQRLKERINAAENLSKH